MMPPPLKSFQPLIPVPLGNGAATPAAKADVEDLFATLFSPGTPPASPNPSGSAPIFSPPSSAQQRVRSTSVASPTDSDFGAFVSVPASEDPLAQPPSGESSPVEPSARRRLSASTGFFAEARAATVRNQQGFLTELLEHEDDPMYWHKHASSVPVSNTHSGAGTPQPQPEGSAFDLLGALAEPVKAVTETALEPLLDALNEAVSDNAFVSPPPPQTEPISIAPRRTTSPSPISRSPSLPPSPSRPSLPVLTRTESISTFSQATLPPRWMSSFLTYRGPPPSASPPPRPVPRRADITHGSPFAAAPFVPASGAPGFDGDRSWNKGFDNGDGEGARDKVGVQLLGRKETTRAVLGAGLADGLRSHLPARSRLLRSWTLLFSLDQHGISLHTLYARCSAHAGGAVLIIRDAEGGCFGAWVADGIHEGHGSYSGSGESFLWKMHGDSMKVFKWTGKNDYVALCEPESISFGGGDGRYGLYLDDTLFEGSSARCPTFNNEPLCSLEPTQGGTAKFECVGLEVWGVGPS